MSSLEALGFSYIVAAAPPGSTLTVEAITDGLNAAAVSRGIEIVEGGSDALDASRDLIIDDAVRSAGGSDHLVDGDTLYVVSPGIALSEIIKMNRDGEIG